MLSCASLHARRLRVQAMAPSSLALLLLLLCACHSKRAHAAGQQPLHSMRAGDGKPALPPYPAGKCVRCPARKIKATCPGGACVAASK